MKRNINRIISFIVAGCIIAQGSITVDKPAVAQEATVELTQDEINSLNEQVSGVSNQRTSVHDPSVVTAQENGKEVYYIFGSHMTVSKSYDLMNWESVYSKENDINSALFGTVENGTVVSSSFLNVFESNQFQEEIPVSSVINSTGREKFGEYNAEMYTTGSITSNDLSGNLWAPDVIYNTQMGKWCMYLSLNGKNNTQHSVIVLLTADNVDGPYVYQGPVVFTRMSQVENEGNYWENTDLKLVYGNISSIPERYKNTSAGDWASYYPHAIDPGVFYDEGGKLWMVYGSWSGGIYMLELDESTGLRDYTITYEDTSKNNGITDVTTSKEVFGKDISADPYYGKKVAGGYYVSGEGPYIQYINNRYYLFLSYGDYAPNGNYQMRVFSSEQPDGPYVDTKGTSAIYNAFSVNYNSTYCNIGGVSDNNAPSDTRGARLMTNYKWSTMDKGEVSQGHNSVLHTSAGDFVIYHTKFNDGSLTHEVRVHQLFTTDNGELLLAPYEYDNTIIDKSSYQIDEVVGRYDILFQNYDTNKRYDEETKKADDNTNGLECEVPTTIELKSDGNIYCNDQIIGTYFLDGKKVQLMIDSAYESGKYVGTYEGILLQQNADGKEKTCITAVNKDTGLAVWGTAGYSDQEAIGLTDKNMKISIPSKTSSNINLPTDGLSGAKIQWISDNPDIISNEGVVASVAVTTQATLTQIIYCGNYYYKKSYVVNVCNKNENPGTVNITLDNDQAITVIDNPFYKKNLNQLYMKYTINWNDKSLKSGWDGLFSFFSSITNGRVAIQSAPYVCYNDLNGNWLDVNHVSTPGTVNKALSASKGEDYTYEIYITQDQIHMYENGVEFTPSMNTDNGSSAKEILTYISEQCDKFSWGTASKTGFWNTEICQLKDVVISDRRPIVQTYQEDMVIGEATEPVVVDNPFNGETIDSLVLEYTAKYAANASLDGWRTLFSFYNDTNTESSTKGRISVQTAPYICYNEMKTEPNSWIDVNSPNGGNNVAMELKKDKDYYYKIIVTDEGVRLFLDGEEITAVSFDGNAKNTDLLQYLSACTKLSFGAKVDSTSFWWTENATLSNIRFSINEVSAIGTGIVTPQYYTVTYNMKGHGDLCDSVQVEKDTLLQSSQIPTAQGYQFKGWYKDGSYKEEWDFANDLVTKDLTLYAKWEKIGEVPSATLLNSYAIDQPSELNLHTQTEGGNYLPEYSFNNPWKNCNLEDGVTVSFTLNKSSVNTTNYGAIFSINSAEGKLYFTAGGYLGFNSGDAFGYTDGNKPDDSNFIDFLPRDKDVVVTIQIKPDDCLVYVDKILVYNKNKFVDSSNFYGYEAILDFLSNANTLYFGYGSFWNSEQYDIVHASLSKFECYKGIKLPSSSEDNGGDSSPTSDPTPTPTPTPTPSTTPEQSAKKEEVVSGNAIGWQQVEELVKNIVANQEHNSNTKEEVCIQIKNGTIIPTSIIKMIAGTNVDIVYDMGNYKWKISGDKINQFELDKYSKINSNINLGVTSITDETSNNEIKSYLQNTLKANKDKRTLTKVSYIKLAHNGTFPFEARLTLNVGKAYVNQYIFVNYVDKESQKVSPKCYGRVDDVGLVTISINQSAHYVLTLENPVLPTLIKSKTLTLGSKFSLAKQVKNPVSGDGATYYSSKKSIATVSSEGIITAKKEGTTTITTRYVQNGKVYVFKTKVKVKK